MRLSYAFRDKLAARGGAILNVCSMYSFFGAPHAPAYSASKGGVAQLTKSLAVAWAKDNIRVNALAPGWIESAMTAVPRANPTRNAELMVALPDWAAGARPKTSPVPRFSSARRSPASSPARSCRSTAAISSAEAPAPAQPARDRIVGSVASAPLRVGAQKNSAWLIA